MNRYKRPQHHKPHVETVVKRRLSLNEGLTLLVSIASIFVAVASLAVSWRSAQDARNNTDIRRAIGNLSKLASQTNRQADFSAAQVAILQGQANDSKIQTRAISAQTEAIAGSSAATILAADAQRIVSIDAANASRPRFSMRDLSVSDLRQDLPKADVVPLTLNFMFKNTGGTSATVKKVRYDFVFGRTQPSASSFIGHIEGNDVVITSAIDSALSPKDAIGFTIPKEIFVRFRDGNTNLLFYGEIDFTDIGDGFHTQCFAYSAVVQAPDKGIIFKPADTSSLKCA